VEELWRRSNAPGEFCLCSALDGDALKRGRCGRAEMVSVAGEVASGWVGALGPRGSLPTFSWSQAAERRQEKDASSPTASRFPDPANNSVQISGRIATMKDGNLKAVSVGNLPEDSNPVFTWACLLPVPPFVVSICNEVRACASLSILSRE
jgi:hypothetical protein